VHGRWSYIRITALIYIAFYCNLAFCTPLVIYNGYSGYTSTALFPSSLVSFLAFFAFPLFLSLGISDQDIVQSICLQNPEAYRRLNGAKSQFNAISFFSWIAASVYQGVLVFFIPYIIVRNPGIMGSSGQIMDFAVFSQWSYMVSIITHTLVFSIHVKYFSVLTVLAILDVFLSLFGITLFLSLAYPEGELGGVYLVRVIFFLLQSILI
jgi:magnesium-transporting ATPase (P-type)